MAVNVQWVRAAESGYKTRGGVAGGVIESLQLLHSGVSGVSEHGSWV